MASGAVARPSRGPGGPFVGGREGPGQSADGEVLALTCLGDLLEQLHLRPRRHATRSSPAAGGGLSPARGPHRVGPNQMSTRLIGGARSDDQTQRPLSDASSSSRCDRWPLWGVLTDPEAWTNRKELVGAVAVGRGRRAPQPAIVGTHEQRFQGAMGWAPGSAQTSDLGTPFAMKAKVITTANTTTLPFSSIS